MTDLTRDVLNALTFVAALCGLALLVFAAFGFLLASYRVGVKQRPLVIPFGGSDERRGSLTALFVMQLAELEDTWVRRVREVEFLKAQFEDEYRATMNAAPAGGGATPLADASELPHVLQSAARMNAGGRTGLAGVGMAPRSAGDEPHEYVLALDDNSILAADLGVVSLAGVSFSPNEILALFRRLPGVFARRRISGTIAEIGNTIALAVTYEELPLRGPARRARRIVPVPSGDWMAAIDALAFQLAKGRVEVLRQRRGDSPRTPAPGSDTAERAFIEADSWAACEAFLRGYASQLRHYTAGTTSDREDAIKLYTAALERQPGFTRAHYNRATMLYNRYLASDNKRAIEDFQAATESQHDRLRALAFAGLAMAFSQEVHRFGGDKDTYAELARAASEQALALDQRIEESHFAGAWALQTAGRWLDAVAAYERVWKLDGSNSIPGARIKSFAYNNAAWIALNELGRENELLREAERRLWEAVGLYPNKIAYANLAEVARRHGAFDKAETLFEYAVTLDPHYVNGWHERALLQLERAAHAADTDAQTSTSFYARALRDQARAEEVADDATADRVKKQFQRALGLRRDALRQVMSGV